MHSDSNDNSPIVLVTGITGYIASHITQQLLYAGYRVRGTVRSSKAKEKYQHLYTLHPNTKTTLALVEADLRDNPLHWKTIIEGCTYVLHVASPFPAVTPKDIDNELIKPAVEGTLNVLQGIFLIPRTNRPRRLVLTSSVAAIYSGHAPEGHIFTEHDWSILDKPVIPVLAYSKSKTLAEQSAWKFLENLPENDKNTVEFCTINPGFVFGPILSNVPCTSIEPLVRLLLGTMPAVPDIVFPSVDVRDVAKAHILAMIKPYANKKRFILCPYNIPLREVADLLAKEFRPYNYPVPTLHLPNFFFHVGTYFDSTLLSVKDMVNVKPQFSNQQSEALLGITWHTKEEAVIDMAYSLIHHRIIPDKSKDKQLHLQRLPKPEEDIRIKDILLSREEKR